MTTDQLIREAKKAHALVTLAEESQIKFAKTLDIFVSEPNQSAADLAEAIDVSPQYLSDVRHSRRIISAGVLERIADLDKTRSK